MLEKEEKILKQSERQEQLDSVTNEIITKIIEKEIEASPVFMYYSRLRELDINFKTRSNVKSIEGKIPSSSGFGPELRNGQPIKRKVGRNELCPCGSGRKYKKCCLGKK